jgi:thymidylate synthase
MEEYQQLVSNTLQNGLYKENRTNFDVISDFAYSYSLDISSRTPIVTTKDFYWNSFIHELLWYLSGESHIRTLQEETGIWDEWSEDGLVETSYARFWRRFPLADHTVAGEAWVDETQRERWLNDDGETFDQIQYILDTLEENPYSRRIVLNSWHPGNAAVSKLPPCHFTAVFNVQGDGTLNCHMTQRSGDVALGIPFNIAGYSLLTQLIADQTGFEPGTFSHTIVDAHIYCGDGERGVWYDDNLQMLQQMIAVDGPEVTKSYIEANAPDPDTENSDHIPGLLEQLTRTPYESPTVQYPSDKHLFNLTAEDFELVEYTSHPPITFEVAE